MDHCTWPSTHPDPDADEVGGEDYAVLMGWVWWREGHPPDYDPFHQGTKR